MFPQLVRQPPPVSASGLRLYTPEDQVFQQRAIMYDPICIYPLLPIHVEEAGSLQRKAQDAQSQGVPLAYELWLAPDVLQRAKISGGAPYHIVLPSQEMDSTFFDWAHNALFVNYLRICFRWGGFPSFEEWSEHERPHELLSALTAELLPL